MSPSSDPVDEYIEEYRLHKEPADSTVKYHRRELRRFKQFLEEREKGLYDDVSLKDFLLFRQWLIDEHGLSDGSVTNAAAAVSQFFEVMRPDVENPVREWDKEGKWTATTEKKQETRQEVVYLSKNQVGELIDHAPSPTTRSKLILRMLAATGIRRSELVTLRCDDVDVDNQTVSIYDRKTDEYRTVGFRDAKLARALRLWLDVDRASEYAAQETDYLLPPGNSGSSRDHLSEATVGWTVTKAASDAGIQGVYTTDASGRERQKVTPHTLRATFAVQCAKEGISAPYVQEALGHHSLDITQVYADVADEDAADVIQEGGPAY